MAEGEEAAISPGFPSYLYIVYLRTSSSRSSTGIGTAVTKASPTSLRSFLLGTCSAIHFTLSLLFYFLQVVN